jgi:hypothetical protein
LVLYKYKPKKYMGVLVEFAGGGGYVTASFPIDSYTGAQSFGSTKESAFTNAKKP